MRQDQCPVRVLTPFHTLTPDGFRESTAEQRLNDAKPSASQRRVGSVMQRSNPQMEAPRPLTWIHTSKSAPARPRLCIHPSASCDPLAPAPPGETPVEFSLTICGDPRCACSSILLEPMPDANGSLSHARSFPSSAWFNLATQSLEVESEATVDARLGRLEGLLRAHLTAPDIEKLGEWFATEKLQLIYSSDLREIDLSHLPDSNGGIMIRFDEVFPAAADLSVNIHDVIWSINDQYCVQLRCKCTETILTVAKTRDTSGPLSTIRYSLGFRFNYRTYETKLLTAWPDDAPSPEEFLKALRAAYPHLDDTLTLRHSILARIYAQQAFANSECIPPSEAPARQPKIGRNAPCPCGSGKKYKYCCWNKSEPPQTEFS